MRAPACRGVSLLPMHPFLPFHHRHLPLGLMARVLAVGLAVGFGVFWLVGYVLARRMAAKLEEADRRAFFGEIDDPP